MVTIQVRTSTMIFRHLRYTKIIQYLIQLTHLFHLLQHRSNGDQKKPTCHPSFQIQKQGFRRARFGYGLINLKCYAHRNFCCLFNFWYSFLTNISYSCCYYCLFGSFFHQACFKFFIRYYFFCLSGYHS